MTSHRQSPPGPCGRPPKPPIVSLRADLREDASDPHVTRRPANAFVYALSPYERAVRRGWRYGAVVRHMGEGRYVVVDPRGRPLDGQIFARLDVKRSMNPITCGAVTQLLGLRVSRDSLTAAAGLPLNSPSSGQGEASFSSPLMSWIFGRPNRPLSSHSVRRRL